MIYDHDLVYDHNLAKHKEKKQTAEKGGKQQYIQ